MMANGSRAAFINGVDWTLRIVGVLSFVVAGFVYTDNNRTTECQAAINTAIAQRAKNLDADLTRERETGRRVDDALAAVVAAVLSQQIDNGQSRQLFANLSSALGDQAKARAAADKARADNPPVEPNPNC